MSKRVKVTVAVNHGMHCPSSMTFDMEWDDAFDSPVGEQSMYEAALSEAEQREAFTIDCEVIDD